MKPDQSDILSLKYFVCGTNPDFFKARSILQGVADKMQQFYFDDSMKVLNVSMPPRFGKSFLATLFTVWIYLFVNRNAKVMRICNTQGLFNTFSKQTRQYFEDFSPLANGMQKLTTNGTIDKWFIEDSTVPNFFGSGILGNITGHGADIAIFDDMYKNYQDATSATYDNFLNDYLQAVVWGRLEKNNYKIINIGTRWTVNDWFAKFKPDMEITITALNELDQTVCEDYKSTVELLEIRQNIEPYLWNAQFMQAPTLVGRMRIFDTEKWEIVKAETIPSGKTYIVIDPATDFGNDYFVIGSYRKYRGQLFLTNMWAKRAAKLSEVASVLDSINFEKIFIETNGYGKEVYRRLVGDFEFPNYLFSGFATTTDKYNRASLAIEFIENNLSISEDCENLELLKSQANVFPKDGEPDDLIDNVVMAVENFNRMY